MLKIHILFNTYSIEEAWLLGIDMYNFKYGLCLTLKKERKKEHLYIEKKAYNVSVSFKFPFIFLKNYMFSLSSFILLNWRPPSNKDVTNKTVFQERWNCSIILHLISYGVCYYSFSYKNQIFQQFDGYILIWGRFSIVLQVNFTFRPSFNDKWRKSIHTALTSVGISSQLKTSMSHSCATA